MPPTLPNAELAVRETLSAVTLDENCLHYPGDVRLEAIGVDSVGMIELVYGLEQRLAIRIADDEVAPEHFASIGSLVALVARKCLC